MSTRTIKIIASNISNGNLTLNDHGHTQAKAGDTIIWQIQNDSGVDAIVAIYEKAGSTDIFSGRPHPQGNNWVGDIRTSIPPYTIYIYAIEWKRGNNTYLCDPIISIKPSAGTPFLENIVGYIIGLISLSLFLLLLSNKRKIKRK